MAPVPWTVPRFWGTHGYGSEFQCTTLTVHFFYHTRHLTVHLFYHPSQFIFYHPSQFIFFTTPHSL